MMKILTTLTLLTCALGWAGAQDAATSLQVAPSDQVRYPDATQVLNKTEPPAPKPLATPVPTAGISKALPSTKPLAGTKPVPAEPAKVAVKTPAPQGWHLRWMVPGDEAAVKTWAQGLKMEVQVNPAGENLWEVVSGPIDPTDLPPVWKDQAGLVSLVRR